MTAVLIEVTALTSPGEFWGLGVGGAGYTFLCDPLNNTSALTPVWHMQAFMYATWLCPSQKGGEGSSSRPGDTCSLAWHSLCCTAHGLLSLRPVTGPLKGRWRSGFRTQFTAPWKSPASGPLPLP